jgi:hypothetical protein
VNTFALHSPQPQRDSAERGLLIKDALGKTVNVFEIVNEFSTFEIEANSLKPGLYFYSIVSKDGVIIESRNMVIVQ